MKIVVNPVDAAISDGVGKKRLSVVDGGYCYHKLIFPVPTTTTINRTMYLVSNIVHNSKVVT